MQTIRAPEVARGIGIVVGLALLIFLGFAIKTFRNDQAMIGMTYLGMGKNEVLYTLGAPLRVRSGAEGPWVAAKGVPINAYDGWQFADRGGGLLEVDFDPASGSANRMSCADEELRSDACPRQLGINVGDMEDFAVFQAGRPTEQIFRRTDKLMVYGDIGMTLTLRELRVRAIQIEREKGSMVEQIGRFLRVILP